MDKTAQGKIFDVIRRSVTPILENRVLIHNLDKEVSKKKLELEEVVKERDAAKLKNEREVEAMAELITVSEMPIQSDHSHPRVADVLRITGCTNETKVEVSAFLFELGNMLKEKDK